MRFSIKDFAPTLHSAGVLLLVLATIMLIPLGAALWLSEPSAASFGFSTVLTGFTGILLATAYKPPVKYYFETRTAFLFTSFGWFIVCFFGALPFAFTARSPSWSLCFLEATSALTTTGLSHFHSIAQTPVSFMVWRTALQWLGGIGITIMALTLFPFLKIGGMQLFASESSSHYEKLLPKVSQIAKFLFTFYMTMTVVTMLLLWLAGMTPLKSFYYSVGAISTSGLSMHDGHINYMHNPAIPWILMCAMLLSASPFLLFIRLTHKDWRGFWSDSQLKGYIKWIIIACTLAFLALYIGEKNITWPILKATFFHTISMLTTSGFHAHSTEAWTTFLEFGFLLLAIIGGCTGSTAGGIKIFRLQILYRAVRAQTYRMIMPHGVFTPVYNKKIVPPSAIYAVLSLFLLFIIHFCILTLILLYYKIAPGDSIELSANLLSNCGAYFFDLRLDQLPHSLHWVFSLSMLLGRLEFLTIWIICVPFFWKR